MPMETPQVPSPEPVQAAVGPGVVSSGWLATNSVFEHRPEQKLGMGLGASLILHGIFLALILLYFTVVPQQTRDDLQNQIVHLVYTADPGPGGGGGGSPAPAPPKRIEVPKMKADSIPVTPPTPVPPPPDPPPQILAPVMTNTDNLIQATGASNVSLAAYAGGGSGGGIGAGRGNGVGPGEGGGEGGGPYRPGNGIVNPVQLKEVKPNYTPDAMRLKIQGTVVLEAVVLKNGTVGNVKVIKSLDRGGLDDEAIRAARGWLFKPATKDGKPVDIYITLELAFRLH
jgi:TonB family protein